MEGIATPLTTLAIEQSDFVFWPPSAMVDTVTQVVGMTLQRIDSHVRGPRGKGGLNCRCRPRSQPFIGIETEHPRVRGMLQGQIFLGHVTEKYLANHPTSSLPGNGDRPVRALTIDDDNFISKCH
jgi:hypothetical protein